MICLTDREKNVHVHRLVMKLLLIAPYVDLKYDRSLEKLSRAFSKFVFFIIL